MSNGTTVAPTPESLREALRPVADPTTGKDIVSAGVIEAIEVRGGLVHVALLADRARAPAMEPVCRQVEAVLARQPGVMNVTAVLTSHRAPASASSSRAAPTKSS